MAAAIGSANSRRAEPFSGLQARSCRLSVPSRLWPMGLCVRFHSLPCGWVVKLAAPAPSVWRSSRPSPISLRSGIGNARRTRSPRRGLAKSILLVGDPVLIGTPDASAVAELRGTTSVEEPWQLPRLPGSRREVESIVKIASGWHSDVLLGEAATKAAVLAAPLGTFRVIHFATHARLDVHDPQLSSIRLSARPRAGSQNQADLSLRDIVGLGLSADSVVLSACEGSLGKEYRGQLSFGLSEAFLLAGAHNVVGSLWRVSDVATEKYMRFYYEAYMGRGLSAVAAAQSAARQLMRDPVYGQPFYRAAFVVLVA